MRDTAGQNEAISSATHYDGRSVSVSLTVALCDSVLGKGQHQLGRGERSYFPNRASKPGSRHTIHWLSCSQLCSRALRLG